MYRRPPRPTLFPDTTLCRSEVTAPDRREVAEQRRDEPWFAAAYAAFERIWSGEATDADWTAITPFLHGRWDDAARASAARADAQRDADAAARYYDEGAPDPSVVRAALAEDRTSVV